MTEEDWMKTNSPVQMVEYVARRTTQRKLRLFACAGCRRIWHVMRSEVSHRAVEISECFAEGQANRNELRLIAVEARHCADSAEQLQTLGWNAAQMARWATHRHASLAAKQAARTAADADLVREHFGNPFRCLHIADDVLSWQDRTIIRLAQAAYAERILPAGILDSGRLLILADALEEAGCNDEQILTHLRSGGEHYRGCWVIDLLLGKQ